MLVTNEIQNFKRPEIYINKKQEEFPLGLAYSLGGWKIIRSVTMRICNWSSLGLTKLI